MRYMTWPAIAKSARPYRLPSLARLDEVSGSDRLPHVSGFFSLNNTLGGDDSAVNAGLNLFRSLGPGGYCSPRH